MEDGVLRKYKKFLKDIENGNISEMNLGLSHNPNFGLDFVDVFSVGGNVDFCFSLDPYSKNSGRILSALELCKNDNNIVSRKDLVEIVFPKICPLVSEALAERNDSSYNEDIFSENYKPRKRNDIICLMEAIEQNSDVKLDYNWGL